MSSWRPTVLRRLHHYHRRMDVEDLHTQALRRASTTYTDPSTGFTVFTELAHLQRGVCCGSQCRHCPYGWKNVRSSGARREAKVASGDKAAIARMIQEIQDRKEVLLLPPQRSFSTSSTSNNTKPTGGRHGGRLTDKNVPYTRTGDKGSSQLLTGERRSKADLAFEAMGTVDELCAVVGVAHAQLQADGQLSDWLLDIMSRLFDVGSHVAKPKKDPEDGFVADGIGGGFDEEHIQELEDWIDLLTEELPELRSFILPTGHLAAAQLHQARCVCRRAERVVVPLVEEGVCDPRALQYLNRLSDFLFAAARAVNHRAGQDEIQYRKPFRGSKQRDRIVLKEDPSE